MENKDKIETKDKIEFKDFNLSEKMLDALKNVGYETPTPIQEGVIKFALEGKDIIGQAQTGTGKTAAFAIPIIENTDIENRKIQHLVLAPTRELAEQIYSWFKKIGGQYHGVEVALIVGGVSYLKQKDALKQKPHIVIATPGRWNDWLSGEKISMKIDLSEIRSFTLDEADELLKIGFLEPIKEIARKLPKRRQNFFFTATFDKKTKALSEMMTVDPEIVSVSQGLTTSVNIKQEYVEMKENNKLMNLVKFLDLHKPVSAVIFGRTKRRVDELTEALRNLGYLASGIQGDMQQRERQFVMDKFRKQEIKILVATDVMARGIDVDHIDWVFNFDLPQEVEYYTHRIGRTGRAGKLGHSLSFVKPGEIPHIERIAYETHSVIEERKIPSDEELKHIWEQHLFNKFNDIIEQNKNAKYTFIQDDLFERYTHRELAVILADFVANSKTNKKDIKLSPEPGVIVKEVRRPQQGQGKKRSNHSNRDRDKKRRKRY